MIKFSAVSDDNLIKITVIGHAEQNVFNKDIVCSSVSTLLITNSNLLYELDNKNNFELSIKSGNYSLIVNNITVNNKIIAENIIKYLQELAIQYPKYIKEENNA